MNSLKFKKKEDLSIFQSIQYPERGRYQKHNFLQKNESRRKNQQFKLQRSYRQPRSVYRKQRYDSVDVQTHRNQKVRSLTLKKSNENLGRSLDKSIKMFKVPKKYTQERHHQNSLQNTRQVQSPYLNKSKKLLLNKKLTILDKQQNIRNRIQQGQSRSMSKRKFRVKSNFTKLQSIDFNDKIIYQPSSQLKQRNSKQKISLNSSISKRTQQCIQILKKLVKGQMFKQALSVIKKYFAEQGDKQNPQILFLFATSMYHLQEYQQVTKIIQKLLLVSPNYNSEIYIMSCLSWAKNKYYPKSLQIIEKGLLCFPQNAQLSYYKGKILYHMKRYQQAETAFHNSYKICALPQTMICLSDCYRKTNQKQKYIKILQKLLAQKNINLNPNFNYESLFLKKLKVLFELRKFQQIMNEILLIEKQRPLSPLSKSISHEFKAQIQFIDGMAKFKKGKLTKAFQKFQDCLLSQYFYLKSLKMLIVIQILQKNFYEASHLCNQAQKQNIKIQSDDIFNLITLFVDGSINLVRRNFREGIQNLSKVEVSLQKKYSKYNQILQYQNYQEVQNYECFQTVRNLIHLFMSYGLFCIGQYSLCQAAIRKQRQLFNEPKYEKGLSYNYKLCEAILAYQQKRFQNALSSLQEADDIFPSRMQVLFYRSVVLIHVYLKSLEIEDNKQQFFQEEQTQIFESIKSNLKQALSKLSSTANNTRATILYYLSLVHAYLGQWKQSLSSIQQTIAKTDDNYWRYYYTKAMILCCIHNFQDAISELNIAINLSDGNKAECFLLRSKCLQIQAKGNEAFYDLQQYIALKPEDEEIHMYAGQLLFQNGAFQDAMVAFEHKEVLEQASNFDIFLTVAKTLFLTGKFEESYKKMLIAMKLKPQQSQLQFDANIINFIGSLFKQITLDKIKFSSSKFIEQLQTKFHKNSKNMKEKNKKFGKIFRQMDYYQFKALIQLYSGNYSEAATSFENLLSQKRKYIIFDERTEDQLSSEQKALLNKSQEDLQKTSNQLKIYSNQMKFNIFICYLADGNLEKAKQILNDIKISQKETFFDEFCKFKNKILTQNFLIENQEVFPNKNKISQFLPPVNIFIKQKNAKLKIKLCIPFPKVQPPQIFPTFDVNLLKMVTVYGIQGKPQAPWIVKQDNIIKFTQKIQYFSRLDFNDSEPRSSKTAIIDINESGKSSKYITNYQQISKNRSSMFSRRTLKKKNSLAINI